MDCSLPGSSIRGILQARILEWVAVSFFRRSSQPRDQTRVSRVASRHFTIYLLLFSCSVVPDSLQHHGLQHAGHHLSLSLALFSKSKRWTHVHSVDDAIPPSHPLSPLFSSYLQSFPSSGSVPMSRLYTSGAQSVGASASVKKIKVQITET